MTEDHTIEEKNRKKGMIATIGIHALLLLILYFAVVWKEQIPPPEPIGMAMNFGNSDQGFGAEQPQRTQSEDSEPQPQTEEVVEEVVEDTPVEESVPDPVAEPVETITEPVKTDSPIKVEEKKTETPPVEKPKEEEVKPQPKKLNAVFGPKSDKENKSTSEGTSEGTTGDQGSAEGDINSKTTTGGAGGGGGGISHDFTGWKTDFRLPANKPEATGLLVFKIKIDGNGNVVSISVDKSIGNPSAEKFYRDLIVRDMRFRRTLNGDIPPFSEGKVSLNLKVK